MENLKKQIEDMEKKMSKMQAEINRLSSSEKMKGERNYTRTDIVSNRTTFRENVRMDKSVNIANLPASSSGLKAGDLYRTGTDLKIIT